MGSRHLLGAAHAECRRCQRDVNQRSQLTATAEPANGFNQSDLLLAETRRKRLRRNGKEGVDGSSPSEGLKYFCCLP